MQYKISEDTKLDLARIYWRGVEVFGESQAEHKPIALNTMSLDENQICSTDIWYKEYQTNDIEN